MNLRLAAYLRLARLLRELSVWAGARADALTARATALNLRALNSWRRRNARN